MFQCKEADGTDFHLEVTFAVLLKACPGFVHVLFAWEAQRETFGRLRNRARGVLNFFGGLRRFSCCFPQFRHRSYTVPPIHGTYHRDVRNVHTFKMVKSCTVWLTIQRTQVGRLHLFMFLIVFCEFWCRGHLT